MDIAVEGELTDEVGELRAQARPWPRLWGRVLDISIYITPLSFIVGYIFPNFVMLPAFDGRGGSMLLGAVLLPFAMMMDAIIVSVFGNSLGKWLIGTRVETIRHEPQDFGTAFNRNLRLYFKGLGLGIPIVALIQYGINFSKVEKGEQTAWDRDSFTRVYDINSSLTRTFLTAIACLALSIGGAVLDIMDEQDARQAPAEPGWDPSRPRTDPIAAQLKQSATQVQPQQIDEITRLEGADSYGRIFTYHYTIARRDAPDERLKQFLNEMMVPKVCGDKNMRSDMDNYAITYRYNYTLPSNTDALIIDVNAERCKELNN